MFWDACSKKILGKTQQAISTMHVHNVATGMVIALLGLVFLLGSLILIILPWTTFDIGMVHRNMDAEAINSNNISMVASSVAILSTGRITIIDAVVRQLAWIIR